MTIECWMLVGCGWEWVRDGIDSPWWCGDYVSEWQCVMPKWGIEWPIVVECLIEYSLVKPMPMTSNVNVLFVKPLIHSLTIATMPKCCLLMINRWYPNYTMLWISIPIKTTLGSTGEPIDCLSIVLI